MVVGCHGGGFWAVVHRCKILDPEAMTSKGEAARLALRCATLQQWWQLSLAMWLTRGGAAGDPGVVVALAVASPWYWFVGHVLVTVILPSGWIVDPSTSDVTGKVSS